MLLYFSFGLTIITISGDIIFLTLIRYNLESLRDMKLTIPAETVDVTELPATMFKTYLRDFKKHYEGHEILKRFEIFKNSLNEIRRMNRESGAKFGLTKLSDNSKGEFMLPSYSSGPCTDKSMTCGRGLHAEELDNLEYIPNKFDWRDRGFVGPVLDQKLCNGCWAFGIVGAMESKAAIINKAFGPRRSIQQLIDCADSQGCEKGNVVTALSWLCVKNQGVLTEKEYPLKDVTQTCKYNHTTVGLQVKRFSKKCRMTSEQILSLVYSHGPLIVVVNADPWYSYIDGIIQGGCIRKPGVTNDHVVQIVGYDYTSEVPHYIVRNSWGEDFGMEGYVKLAIEGNVCGVRDEVVVVDVYHVPF